MKLKQIWGISEDIDMHMKDATPLYAELVEENKKLTRQVEILKKTLRDEFAISAMNAIIIGNNADDGVLNEGAAKDAYFMANAMMEVREL